ncbi:hypothetical protein MSAR_39330 [Mycolicibacterium sarraceniae]|uniref:Uncharacterized protein n=1 Tax=Mycolicibacterium sarraceniae TaxID=1534348 RepID=A0A7I7SUV2_9MYCO|nr:hypothetical protein MSAR_39330 [Mycolicibacterium sarraceniae]
MPLPTNKRTPAPGAGRLAIVTTFGVDTARVAACAGVVCEPGAFGRGAPRPVPADTDARAGTAFTVPLAEGDDPSSANAKPPTLPT